MLDPGLHLVLPALEWQDKYLHMADEYCQVDEDTSYHRLAYEDFPSFIAMLERWSRGLDLPPSFVPMTTYWLVKKDYLIGESRLRHCLTPALEITGGHISYEIRPSMRRQGYGNQILSLTLVEARRIKLKRVLLTCDASNHASAAIIEKNGGVLNAPLSCLPATDRYLRYWIDL